MFEFKIESPINKRYLAEKHLHRYQARDLHRNILVLVDFVFEIIWSFERIFRYKENGEFYLKLVKLLAKQSNVWMAALMCMNGAFTIRTFFSVFWKENCSKWIVFLFWAHFWISESPRKLWRRNQSKIQFETISKNVNSKSVWLASWNFRRIDSTFKCGRNHGLLLGWWKSGPRLGVWNGPLQWIGQTIEKNEGWF